PPPPMR
ncbi:hypothetical protein CP10743SC13_0907B, partial [Chlamydia psittaci 10_743_SC13]